MAYSAEQQKNINLILSIAKQRGLPPEAAQIALMTAMVEANLQDHAGASTDHDSGGLFQQRPSAGWGTYEQVRDPVYATNKFFDHLLTVPNWRSIAPGDAAQAVQGSAFPERYQQHYDDAASIMSSAWSGSKPYAGEMGMSTSAQPLASATPLTPAQKQQALQDGAGPLYALAQSVPELKAILLQAVNNGWTASEFQNKITNSGWYRTHSDAVRQSVVLQSSDPATYKQQLDAAGNKVETLMKQMGVSTLTNAQYVSLAKQVQMGTLTDAELQQQIAAHFGSGTGAVGQNYKEGMATGQAAQADAQLRQIYAQYGQAVQPGQMAYRVRQLLSGTTSIDTYKTAAMVAAKAMYPGLSDSIDKGLTVQDLAQPYIQSMSQLLEVAPDSLHLNDPTIKRALQGTGAVAKGQQPTAQPIWQFEQQVKSDPRWQLTKNAHADTSALLMDLGKQWGFES